MKRRGVNKRLASWVIRITHNGCREAMPNFCARRPVMKGRTAEPACPAPAMYPAQPVISHLGRMVVEWFMRMGNMGPRRRPTRETAMAFWTSEGTSQTVISSLMPQSHGQRPCRIWNILLDHSPDGQNGIDEQRTAFSDLICVSAGRRFAMALCVPSDSPIAEGCGRALYLPKRSDSHYQGKSEGLLTAEETGGYVPRVRTTATLLQDECYNPSCHHSRVSGWLTSSQ